MDELKSMSDSDEIQKPDQQKTLTRPSRLKRLLGWLVLPVFGSVVGAALGCFYFVQVPPLYKATAQIQIVNPPKEIPISTFDSRMDNRSRDDELVIVRSSAVLTKAVELGHLTQHRQLLGKSAAEIVFMLKDPRSKMLDVRLGSKDLNSDIIDIGVTTDNADLSAEIVQAIVSGYEEHVNEKVNAFSKDAQNALIRFGEKYEQAKTGVKKELDKLRLNPNLIWRDGKPQDPASEKIVKSMESISEIDGKIRNIEAVMQQITNGREAKRPLEELLLMALNSTSQARVKQRKAGRKEDGSVSIENRLNLVYGVLGETLQKLSFEKGEIKKDAEELKEKMKENQFLINNYAINLADLEAVKEIADQINESLRKLSLGTEFGAKSVTRLEIPTIGRFAGPYWYRYVGLGALFGFCAFSGLAFIFMLADESPERLKFPRYRNNHSRRRLHIRRVKPPNS